MHRYLCKQKAGQFKKADLILKKIAILGQPPIKFRHPSFLLYTWQKSGSGILPLI